MTLLKRLGLLPLAMLGVFLFFSCDEDFTSVGTDVIGEDISAFPKFEAGVKSYSRKNGAVQTNNLPSNLLGVFNEPVYGQHIANVLTQVSLSIDDPDFGTNPVLDSVVLDLPYFSTALPPDAQGNVGFRLDSVFGNGAFKLSVRESSFFLNDFDPEANFQDRQKYFSDQGPLFESFLVGDPILVEEAFEPSAEEVVFFRPSGEVFDTIRVPPRLRVKLPVAFFQEKIIDREGSVELSNNNFFRNFFRGLYFMAEPLNDSGSMILFNFNNADAGITLHYTIVEDDDTTGGDVTRAPVSFKLNFGPNIVNTYSQSLPPPIITEIAEGGPQFGAENLFLRGGEGSMAVIELFQDEDELEELREKDWLINEANLIFYVDQERVPGGDTEPQRVYLYNLATNTPLIDYRNDPTQSLESPSNSLTIHSGILKKGEDGNGIFYKIRITEHVKRILNEGAENVKLGLVISQNINLISNSALKNPGENVKRVPASSVISPRGTVLHGNLSPATAKRLKFNIFFTETN